MSHKEKTVDKNILTAKKILQRMNNSENSEKTDTQNAGSSINKNFSNQKLLEAQNIPEVFEACKIWDVAADREKNRENSYKDSYCMDEKHVQEFFAAPVVKKILQQKADEIFQKDKHIVVNDSWKPSAKTTEEELSEHFLHNDRSWVVKILLIAGFLKEKCRVYSHTDFFPEIFNEEKINVAHDHGGEIFRAITVDVSFAVDVSFDLQREIANENLVEYFKNNEISTNFMKEQNFIKDFVEEIYGDTEEHREADKNGNVFCYYTKLGDFFNTEPEVLKNFDNTQSKDILFIETNETEPNKNNNSITGYFLVKTTIKNPEAMIANFFTQSCDVVLDVAYNNSRVIQAKDKNLMKNHYFDSFVHNDEFAVLNFWEKHIVNMYTYYMSKKNNKNCKSMFSAEQKIQSNAFLREIHKDNAMLNFLEFLRTEHMYMTFVYEIFPNCIFPEKEDVNYARNTIKQLEESASTVNATLERMIVLLNDYNNYLAHHNCNNNISARKVPREISMTKKEKKNRAENELINTVKEMYNLLDY